MFVNLLRQGRLPPFLAVAVHLVLATACTMPALPTVAPMALPSAAAAGQATGGPSGPAIALVNAGTGADRVTAPAPSATGVPAQSSSAPVRPARVAHISPKPGTDYHPAETTIALGYRSLLGPADLDGLAFQVSGTASGSHPGTVVLSDDGRAVIFKPAQPFAPAERVNVSVTARDQATGGEVPAARFSFTIAPPSAAPIVSTTGPRIITQHSAPPRPAARRYETLPSDFPAITVTVPASDTAPGLLFATNFGLSADPSGYYLMILDNQGEPVWYRQLPANTRSLDFKMQPDGSLSYSDAVTNAFTVMDNSYQVTRTIRAGNGYQQLDEHELLILPNGHALILVNEARIMDLSRVVPGGSPNASVTGQVIQEIDRQNNVVFQWRILDYFPVTDSAVSLTTPQIDFSHANAIAVDTDGDLLLSSRHLDEITKIDRDTGAVIWRLGGKGNQFTIAAAPGVSGPAQFYHQHDVRQLSSGHITLFDNHNGQKPQISRALEYAVDEDARTATLLRAYQTAPGVYADAMGSVQLLDNGNLLIGWGTVQTPNLTEVRPDGTKAFELDFSSPDVSYRAFRFRWHGYPTWPPALVLRAADGGLKLAFSWNGATEVSSYRVYGVKATPPGDLLAEVPRAGFETAVLLKDARAAYCYYQLVPVDAGGKAMLPSPLVANPVAKAGACMAQE